MECSKETSSCCWYSDGSILGLDVLASLSWNWPYDCKFFQRQTCHLRLWDFSSRGYQLINHNGSDFLYYTLPPAHKQLLVCVSKQLAASRVNSHWSLFSFFLLFPILEIVERSMSLKHVIYEACHWRHLVKHVIYEACQWRHLIRYM